MNYVYVLTWKTWYLFGCETVCTCATGGVNVLESACVGFVTERGIDKIGG